MSFEKPVVVLDNGSYNVKAGFSCDNHPVSIFRTVVGRPNYLNGSYGKDLYEVSVGEEAVAKIEDLELSNPVKEGRIVHWDNMERIWHHCFYKELKVAPEDRYVMLECSSKTPIKDKFQCCEVFFETLNSPGLCIQPQSVMSLYGSGFTTGVSVDLGYDTTVINPVYEGGMISYAHMQTKLAGRQLSEFIKHKLDSRNLQLGFKTNHVLEDIKKTLYVTKDATSTNSKEYQKIYMLPSGEEVNVSDEAFMAAELLFQPDLVSGGKSEYIPLQEAVMTAVLKCDPELHNDLLRAIVPWGGSGGIPGLNNRLSIEVEQLANKPVEVLYSSEPYAVAWLGGATFAGMSGANKIWVSKKQFEDYGARIVRNKFL